MDAPELVRCTIKVKVCLIMKAMFQLCHIQILKNATDMTTLLTMHDITFTYHTRVNSW